MIRVEELVFEDGYILSSNSYCRKALFIAKDLESNKRFKVKTFISVLDSDEIKMLDAFSEVNIDHKWLNVLDTIPVEVSVENIKKIQKEIFENTLTFLFEKKISINDIENINVIKAFDWNDFDKSIESNDKILNVIDFSRKDL